eukprot:3230621-Pyramimonas_sp.AAC.1
MLARAAWGAAGGLHHHSTPAPWRQPRSGGAWGGGQPLEGGSGGGHGGAGRSAASRPSGPGGGEAA